MRGNLPLVLVSALGVVACGPERRAAPGALLQHHWPEQYASLFEPVSRGGGGLVADLPQSLRAGVGLANGSGESWRVAEPSCGAVEESLGSALVYSCSWGKSVWRTTAAGAEEWLLLPEGANDSVREFRWELEGGRLVQHGRSLDVYDAAGTPRMTMSALAAFDTTGRAIGARLEAEGEVVRLRLDEDVAGPVLIDPAFVPAGSMAIPRCNFSATLLADGRVLAVSGVNNTNANVQTKTAELWDPDTRTWSAAAPAAYVHFRGAALLLDKTVLVAGGNSYETTERYDPAADKWSKPAQCWDCGHTAIRLQDGTVFVMNGGKGERFDPASSSWSTIAPLPGLNSDPQMAVLLPNGNVFVYALSTGGAATYDPSGNSWTVLPKPSIPHGQGATLTLLPSGRALLAGYSGDTTAEIYDPSTNTWSNTGLMVSQRGLHTAATVADGTVVVAGGVGPNSITYETSEIYDEKTNQWTAGPSMAVDRYSHAVVNLGGGKLLEVGGQNEQSSELFAPGNALGVACKDGSECASSYCVDGVCCDTKCNGGQCVVCTKAKGANVDGKCTKANFVACDDGDLCTLNDVCSVGLCKSGKPVVCSALDQCHEGGTCDSKTGKCTNPEKPEAWPCNDGDLCTQKDGCVAGVCVGADPVKCTAAVCFSPGSCNSKTGKCSEPTQMLDGATCDDGNACTLDDVCLKSLCGSFKKVQCPAEDNCHNAGKCDVKTGACKPVAKSDGSPCEDGDPCTADDSCQQGKCIATGGKSCPPPPACRLAGVCSLPAGECSYAIASDGSPCAGGSCQFGACVPTESTGAGTSASVSAGSGSGDAIGGEVILNGRGGGACTVGGRRDRGFGAMVFGGLALFTARRRRRAVSTQ